MYLVRLIDLPRGRWTARVANVVTTHSAGMTTTTPKVYLTCIPADIRESVHAPPRTTRRLVWGRERAFTLRPIFSLAHAVLYICTIVPHQHRCAPREWVWGGQYELTFIFHSVCSSIIIKQRPLHKNTFYENAQTFLLFQTGPGPTPPYTSYRIPPFADFFFFRSFFRTRLPPSSWTRARQQGFTHPMPPPLRYLLSSYIWRRGLSALS